MTSRVPRKPPPAKMPRSHARPREGVRRAVEFSRPIAESPDFAVIRLLNQSLFKGLDGVPKAPGDRTGMASVPKTCSVDSVCSRISSIAIDRSRIIVEKSFQFIQPRTTRLQPAPVMPPPEKHRIPFRDSNRRDLMVDQEQLGLADHTALMPRPAAQLFPISRSISKCSGSFSFTSDISGFLSEFQSSGNSSHPPIARLMK